MPRPATRRRVIAAALACAAMLSACTGNADDGDTPAATATPVVAPSAAASSAQSAVSAAVAASTDVSAAGAAAREKAFTGPALVSANAAAKMLPGRTAGEKADAEVSAEGVKVLAVSRAGDTPAQILAQTTLKKTGAPVLVLLTAPTPAGPYQVAAMAPVLPDAQIDPFDPTTEGSPAVGDGAGLAASPDEVVASFAESVRFPEPVTSKLLAADPLTEQLRQSAKAQSQALNKQGTFTQTYTPQDVLGGVRLQDGKGAVVFAHLDRHDAIAMRTAQKLTPDKELTLLTGIKQITSEAKLTSNEIIAIVIPPSGQSRVVAASDQIVAGSGR
jgi:uncharacterized lipoprotein YbaY